MTVTKMADIVSRAESMLANMEAQGQLYDKRLEMFDRHLQMYKETLDKMMQEQNERIKSAEKRWDNLRNVVVTVVVLVLAYVVTGSTMMVERPTTDEIKSEYFNKDEVLRGMGIIIEDTYEYVTDSVPEDDIIKAKQSVLKEIMPDYITRGQ